MEQAELLSSSSFLRRYRGMITGKKVTAAYAVQTTRDEMQSTFRAERSDHKGTNPQCKPASPVSFWKFSEEDENKIDLGEEPVILAADALSQNPMMGNG